MYCGGLRVFARPRAFRPLGSRSSSGLERCQTLTLELRFLHHSLSQISKRNKAFHFLLSKTNRDKVTRMGAVRMGSIVNIFRFDFLYNRERKKVERRLLFVALMYWD